MEGVVAQELELLAVQVLAVGVDEVVAGHQQEAGGAAGRVADGLARGGGHGFHDGLDERARGEVLAGAALHVLGVLLQQAFVNLALHVEAQARPVFAVDKGQQVLEAGRVLNLVLGLLEDDAQHAGLLAQVGEQVAVLHLQRVAFEGTQAGPVLSFGHGGGVGGAGLLVGHFQEQQVSDLLDVVAVAHAVVAEHGGVAPDALDEGLGGGIKGGLAHGGGLLFAVISCCPLLSVSN